MSNSRRWRDLMAWFASPESFPADGEPAMDYRRRLLDMIGEIKGRNPKQELLNCKSENIILMEMKKQLEAKLEAGRRAAEALDPFTHYIRVEKEQYIDHLANFPWVAINKAKEALTLCREAGLLDEPI